MGIVQWARSPWGQDVPIHIVWALIYVAAIGGLTFLGEQFHVYHAVGIALIAGGIVLASVKKGTAAKDRERINMLWVRRGPAG